MINNNQLLKFLILEAKEIGIENPEDKYWELNDLNDNVFYLLKGLNGGHLILDPANGVIIEKSKFFNVPYNFNNKEKKLYFGPLNYIEQSADIKDCFIDLSPEKNTYNIEQMNELQKLWNESLVEQHRNIDYSVKKYIESNLELNIVEKDFQIEKGKKTYIKDYHFVRNSRFPINKDGSCGFVAGSLILYFWYAKGWKKLIPSSYIDPRDDQLISTINFDPETNLKDKLVKLNNYNTDSWAKPLKDSIVKFCKEINFHQESHYYLGKLNLTNELKKDRPAVFFGALMPPSLVSGTRGKIRHAVAVYGYEYKLVSNYFICNFGWQDDSREVLLSTYVAGSVTTFKPK